jgi:hypothetical protein
VGAVVAVAAGASVGGTAVGAVVAVGSTGAVVGAGAAGVGVAAGWQAVKIIDASRTTARIKDIFLNIFLLLWIWK